MDKKIINELFSKFKKVYKIKEKDKLWEAYNKKFIHFWAFEINAPISHKLDDSSIDAIVKILDVHGKGNTKESDSIGRIMIPQGAWRKMFKEIHQNKTLLEVINKILQPSTDEIKIKAINELYKKNKDKKNYLTGKSANAINTFLAAYSPHENISMVSLKDRIGLISYMPFGDLSDFEKLSIGEKIIISNELIKTGFNKLGINGSAKTLSAFCYSPEFKNKWKPNKLEAVNYWITTHWPPRVTDDASFIQKDVWVPDNRKEAIKKMRKGDFIFIYESKSGRTIIEKEINGKINKIPCKEGKGGIVSLCRITENPVELTDEKPEIYIDDTQILWNVYAKSEIINSSGFIKREKVAKILGYSINYPFKGFGDYKSGLKIIEKKEFRSLLRLYKKSENEIIKQNEKNGKKHGYSGGGEGPEHLALKNKIFDNPSVVLQESGLIPIKIEKTFPTNDRVDILLKDKFGRYVTVEVEVDCSETELAGPLQCMKYRSLLAYYYNKTVKEIRTMLVAHTIHTDVKEKCNKYNIEYVEVPR